MKTPNTDHASPSKLTKKIIAAVAPHLVQHEHQLRDISGRSTQNMASLEITLRALRNRGLISKEDLDQAGKEFAAEVAAAHANEQREPAPSPEGTVAEGHTAPRQRLVEVVSR